jgi:type III restriction enzyme
VRVDRVEKFAKTAYELEQLFNRNCLASCGDYQKDASWERIKYHTQLFFEEYLGIFGIDVYKIVLHNDRRFADLYNLARDKYAQIMAAKASSKTTKIKENEQLWDVPEFNILNDSYVPYQAEAHALEPLYARKRGTSQLFDSNNEHLFIDLLIENETKNISWWYKNGSGNKQDFAIPYLRNDGTQSLFYVDFVIQFKNGTIGLFDPKTIESDPDNVAKHNALIDYVEGLNLKGKNAIGGIIIHQHNSWRYCRNRIVNDRDLTGWEFFNPASINAN